MTRKQILNLTSRKKRNGMTTVTTTGADGLVISPAYGPTFINGRDGAYYLWCPTAMVNTGPNGSNPITADSARTSQTCYMRGLSEHIRIQTNTGRPWFHRRICFTSKNAVFRAKVSTDTPTNTVVPYYDDNARGPERWAQNLANNSNPLTLGGYNGIIFKGSEGYDWSDLIVAPVDTTRVDLKFDKTWTLHSGNANGLVRERKLFHRMGKNLTYDDDEVGERESDTSYYTVTDKRGMGDYYVLDIIQCGTDATASDLFRMTYNSTLYWHEK